MLRALALAARGVGAVEPNPPVGSVIVRDGEEIAAGWHRRFGGPHAEREALAAAESDGISVRGATMYVSLEPCSHYGKTPPCADALTDAGLGRVVVAVEDPDEHVRGRGLARLREAGIAVELGLCETEARQLLAPYLTLRTRGRPWVICKWAQTADGYLALPPAAGRWISCQASRRKVHELRGVCDGICVGSGTLLADDPLLTNRSGGGRRLARLVLDARLRTPPDCRLVRTAGKADPVLVATAARALRERPAEAEALRAAGVELLEVGETNVSLPDLLDELGRRQWTRLLIEGGEAVLRSVLSAGLADEVWAFVAPTRLGDAGARLPRLDVTDLPPCRELTGTVEETVGPDRLLRLRREAT